MAQAKNAKSKDVISKNSKQPVDESKDRQIKHAVLIAEVAPPGQLPEAEIEIEKVSAKAGKRSAKSQKELEAIQAKKAAKDAASERPDKKSRATVKPKAKTAGKKYRQAAKLIDRSKLYPLAEALDLAVKTSTSKFDASLEMHINLGVDPRQADQNVRGTVALPAGTGKNSKIAVLAEGPEAAKAKTAGADFVGGDGLLAKLDKDEIDFDILIAMPAMMPKLGKYARLLGPRGLMPNPKSGTVSQNPAAAVAEARAGRVEYRVDQAGIIHLSIGKVSFGAEKLTQNAQAILSSVRSARPASLKGFYLKSVYVTSTMGPSVKVEVST